MGCVQSRLPLKPLRQTAALAAVSLGTAAVKPPAAAGHVEPLTRSASLLLPDSSKSFLGLVSWGICFGSR